MSVDWDAYEIYDPGLVGPLDTLPRAEARRAFNRVMAERPARLGALRRLLKANGIELATTDTGVQALNDWFRTNVEADPEHPGRLLPEWYSVVNDVALFLSDLIIERCPGIRWEFFTWGKTDVAYQRAVLMGFKRISNPKYNLDIDQGLAGYAHRIVRAQGSIAQLGMVTVRGVEIDLDAAQARFPHREIEPDAFLRWIKIAEGEA